MTLPCTWPWELLNATRLQIWLRKFIGHNQTYGECLCICNRGASYWAHLDLQCHTGPAFLMLRTELAIIQLSQVPVISEIQLEQKGGYFVPNLLPLNTSAKLALLLRQQPLRQTIGISSDMCTLCQCKEGCIGINTSLWKSSLPLNVNHFPTLLFRPHFKPPKWNHTIITKHNHTIITKIQWGIQTMIRG